MTRQVCTHCQNPVVRIDYGEKSRSMMGRADKENVWKHGRPRPFPVCSVNPLMDEDVEEVEEELM